MSRKGLRDAISRELGERRLIWAGLRGSDAESLADLEQFYGSFSILDRYSRRPLEQSCAYEDFTGVREDMEIWDIEDHLDEQASHEFRNGLLRATAAASALVPYRSSTFLHALWFARQDRAHYLGNPGNIQPAFEHKPWVESELKRHGVAGLDWVYIADEEQLGLLDSLAEGPVVLRRSRTSGGEGFFRVADSQELQARWPRGEEAFGSVSRYREGAVSLNVGGVVWGSGVNVHHASVQLIGIEGCVSRPFGYCGNDFTAARDLPEQLLDEIEAITRRVGIWLRGYGYLGAFGVDFLLTDEGPLFTEVNPRFQGSTAASSRLSVEHDLPCLLLEHVAAHLGLPLSPRPPLREQMHSARELAQLVVHWVGEKPERLDGVALQRALRGLPGGCDAEAIAPPECMVRPGGMVGRYLRAGRLTQKGDKLCDDWAAELRLWNAHSRMSTGGS